MILKIDIKTILILIMILPVIIKDKITKTTISNYANRTNNNQLNTKGGVIPIQHQNTL